MWIKGVHEVYEFVIPQFNIHHGYVVNNKCRRRVYGFAVIKGGVNSPELSFGAFCNRMSCNANIIFHDFSQAGQIWTLSTKIDNVQSP